MGEVERWLADQRQQAISILSHRQSSDLLKRVSVLFSWLNENQTRFSCLQQFCNYFSCFTASML